MKKIITKASGLVIACTTPLAMGFTFETETLNGSFDSTITAGMGLRTESRGCNLINQGPTGHNAPSGCLAQSSGVADQGDLNYDRGDMFTNYLKGTHELLLKMPEDITFMARGTWIRDFAATDTTGTLSFNTPESVGSNGLSDDARDDLAFKARLLDLWVSKGFDVGGQRVRARLGNQVINWGESLFVAGGINNTNAYDYQALARPGVQLKEAVLPAPMLSVASGLGSGVNVEAYYQFRWNKANCRRWAATGPPPTRWVRAGGLRILRKGRPRQRPVGPFAALAAGGQRRRLWLLRDALSRQVAIVACRHSRPEHLRGGTDLGVPGRPDDVRHQCQHADR